MKSAVPLSESQTEIMLKIGQNISIARQRRNLSQKELASRSGLSTPTISGLERGVTAATLPTLIKVLSILGIEQTLLNIADPDQDTIGKGLEGLRRKKRSGRSTAPEEDPFNDNF